MVNANTFTDVAHALFKLAHRSDCSFNRGVLASINRPIGWRHSFIVF